MQENSTLSGQTNGRGQKREETPRGIPACLASSRLCGGEPKGKRNKGNNPRSHSPSDSRTSDLQVRGGTWFDTRTELISSKQYGSGVHGEQSGTHRGRKGTKNSGERRRPRVGLPSTRQTTPPDGSIDALARLGYCTYKKGEVWEIRNSRSLEVVPGLGPYDDYSEALMVCDHLNEAVKNQEIELLKKQRK